MTAWTVDRDNNFIEQIKRQLTFYCENHNRSQTSTRGCLPAQHWKKVLKLLAPCISVQQEDAGVTEAGGHWERGRGNWLEGCRSEPGLDRFALAIILSWAGKNGLTNLHKSSEMLMSRDFQSFHSYQTVSAMWKLKWKRPISNQDPGARDMITFYFWAKTVEKG